MSSIRSESRSRRQTRFRQGADVFVGCLLVLAAGCAPMVDPAAAGGQSTQIDEPVAADGRSTAVEEPVATFSIVAFDPETGDLGVAVQSRFFAVGRVVPYAAAGVGAVATQSYANTTYGPRGLELLRQGHTPEEAIAALTRDDPERRRRQVGIVDARGGVGTFTGEECLEWAGGRTGSNYAAQGNILAGPEVVDAMAETFEVTEGDLATRLAAALAAGQAAGGDARGRQSAALLVVREGGGYGGFDDLFIDLRVDDHPAPIAELQRLLDLRHAQMAAAEARRALSESSGLAGDERGGRLLQAREAARRAVALDPSDGSYWMALAFVELQLGERDAAAQAGIRALRVDPWIKTAAMRGLLGNDRTLEELLGLDAFRRVWETIPVQ